MDDLNREETARVLHLRAQGLAYRRIAERLNLPLKKVWALAQQGLGPEPAAPGEGLPDPGPDQEPGMVQTVAPVPDAPQPQTAIRYGPTITLPVPQGATPSPGGIGYELLRTPYVMPTPEDIQKPYVMPAPGGGVYVVPGSAAMGPGGAPTPPPETPETAPPSPGEEQ